MSTSLLRPRSAKDREARRIRIMASVRDGFSYDEIGRREELSRERIRQIVSQSVREHKDDVSDLPRVQIARLEPALRLAAAAVAKGRIGAILPLLKILEKIDNYSAAVGQRDSRGLADEGRRRTRLCSLASTGSS